MGVGGIKNGLLSIVDACSTTIGQRDAENFLSREPSPRPHFRHVSGGQGELEIVT
jgi:hypothetical protein